MEEGPDPVSDSLNHHLLSMCSCARCWGHWCANPAGLWPLGAQSNGRVRQIQEACSLLAKSTSPRETIHFTLLEREGPGIPWGQPLGLSQSTTTQRTKEKRHSPPDQGSRNSGD